MSGSFSDKQRTDKVAIENFKNVSDYTRSL